MLSVICAYNNQRILEETLIKSLRNQKNVEMEMILVNAEEHGFTSASQTLNYAGRTATGEYMVFLHQDVLLEDAYTLSKIENYCRKYEFGVAGAAGILIRNGESISVSQIVHGEDREKAAVMTEYEEPVEVCGLDECMLIIPRKVFQRYPFYDLQRTWHLYATDYVLQMKRAGLPVLVLPLCFWHLSKGDSLSADYYDTVRKLAKYYRKDQEVIYTFFGTWPTDPWRLFWKCLYWKTRLLVKGVLKK